MRYLLDTCVISELASRQVDSNVQTWANEQDEQNLYISSLTFGELQKGVAKLPADNKKSQLQAWIADDLSKRFANRILAADNNVFMCWGELQAGVEKIGKTMPIIDSLIAATALHYKLTIATRNIRDMEASGVQLFNPWEEHA